MISPVEIFVVCFVLAGIGVMLRVINIRAAFMIIGLIAIAAFVLPSYWIFGES